MMMKFFAGALVTLLALAAPAHAWLAQKAAGGGASTSQVLFSGTPSAPSNTADNFMPLGFAALPVASDGNFSVLAVAGNLTSLRAWSSTASPTGAQTWTITVLKNGSSTALECEINSGTAGLCNVTASVAVAAGDVFSVRVRPANSPATSRIKVAAVFEPTTANDTVLLAHSKGYSTSATQCEVISSNYTTSVCTNRRYSIVPDSGTVDKLYIASNAPGAGTSYDYTVMNKNTATAVLCQIAGTATTCNDTTHSFSVTGQSGGTPSTTIADDLAFQAVPTSTPASAVAGMGARFVPATAGRFPIVAAYNVGFGATSTYYWQITGGEGVGSTNEEAQQNIGISMTVEKLSVKLITAPGAGKSLTVTFRKNGSDTALACTIADTDTGCDVSGSISVADDDKIGYSTTPSGTPTVSALAVSMLATR